VVVAANAIRRAAASARSSSVPRAPAGSSRASAAAIGIAALIAALIAYVLADFGAVSQWTQDNQGFAIVIAFCAMWAMLLLLVPLAAVLGLVGLGGIATVIGFQPALTALATEAARFLTDYQIATLPLFLMMGSFAAAAGVASDVYRLAQAVVGSLRGGLALATIAGCAGFGTVTGSSLATIVTFGQISLPEMRARGYSPALATGCVAAGGNLGALIPPSGPLILFALLTEASIGQLFIAAIMPGLLAFLLYSAAVMCYVRFAPSSVPPATRMQSSELAAALRQCGPVVVLFGSVIGGMYTGVFTATEAAAVGAFLAFLLALVRGRLRAATFWQVMAETTESTALIYTLIFGALSFSFFVGITSLPERLTGFIAELDVAPLVIVALILLIYVGLGCIMDSFAILVITVPVVTPLILFLGYDMVWWGIINLVIVEMSTLTPPFGIHVFVLKALVRDVPMAIIFKGVFSFVAADVVKLALLVLFPAITLWLPSTMFK
jgi:tripartite ATP-independent transporter DctM subunit